ncbi:nucleotidyltransferase family protein [Oryzobacter sp. R7]|uniref:nucleotidyltransferase family protein n=1 Tax=Oryzobacter faecalis TaxID=3388656 RepID=UPI00398CC0FC
MTEEALVPVAVRVELAHAAVQRLAEETGVDVLHIKGPAVHPGLRRRTSGGSDVDVIVRPDGVDRLMGALAEHGWRVETTFEAGSAFDHAANLYHPSWGLLDVHRHYPGMDRDPAASFAVLWRTRGTIELGHVPCAVPDPISQSLVLLLHAARSTTPGVEHPDVEPNWTDRTPEDRDRIRALAAETGATVALAAATGTLGEHRDDPEAALWRVFSEGGDRLDEWEARLRSARGARAKASVVLRSFGVNRYYLAQRLGHEPSRREVAVEFARRLGAAGRGLATRVRSGADRGGSAR